MPSDTGIRSDPARMSRGILGNTVIVSGTRYVSLGFGMARNLFVAWMFGPEKFGYWVLFLLVLQYADQVHLGLRLAGDVEIPRLRGAGDIPGAESTARMLFAGIISLAAGAGIIAAVGSTLLYLRGGVVGEYDAGILALVLLVISATIIVDQVGRYHLMIFRTRKEFAVLGISESASDIARAFLVVGLGWMFGLAGAFVAHLCASIGMAFYLHIRVDAQRRMQWDRMRLRSLFVAGLPLFVSYTAYFLIISIDRVAGGIVLGSREFALYGFATTIMLLPVLTSHGLRDVLIPTFGERYGAGGAADVAPLFLRGSRAVAFMIPPITAFVLFGMEAVVGIGLPKYGEALGVMSLLTPGIAFMALASLPVIALMIMGRSWPLLFLEAVAIGTAAILYILLPISLSPMHRLAISTSVLYGVYGLSTFVLTLHSCSRAPRQIARDAVIVATPVAITIALVFVLGRVVQTESMSRYALLGIPIAKAVLFAGAYAGFLFITREMSEIGPTVRALLHRRTA
ncbi:MAG: oligosaccharide flippase family protein [Ignavibacteriae bacterium]|nr:oligosaccharide flippase family protein [Ignavibacteriota bacterium]